MSSLNGSIQIGQSEMSAGGVPEPKPWVRKASMVGLKSVILCFEAGDEIRMRKYCSAIY